MQQCIWKDTKYIIEDIVLYQRLMTNQATGKELVSIQAKHAAMGASHKPRGNYRTQCILERVVEQ